LEACVASQIVRQIADVFGIIADAIQLIRTRLATISAADEVKVWELPAAAEE
jgi:hypothetical protein